MYLISTLSASSFTVLMLKSSDCISELVIPAADLIPGQAMEVYNEVLLGYQLGQVLEQ
jgi:hypothetical protein